jgi:hypothetical protein
LRRGRIACGDPVDGGRQTNQSRCCAPDHFLINSLLKANFQRS